MAFMADFARQPPSRKVLLFVLIGGGLFALYYQFAFKSLDEDLENVKVEQAAKAAQNQQKDAEIEEYKKLKINLPKLQCIITENAKALPADTEVGAFFETINRKVDEAGAHVERSKQEEEKPVERFVKVPASFEITGTFEQIKRFFASLQPKKPADHGDTADDNSCNQERERIVTIENLSLTDPRPVSGSLVLTAKFVAATFRQEEAKDAAKPTGTATAPKSSTAPATTPPPADKKLPPAATPAGAKARVDDAMDKDQQRTDTKVGSDRLKGGL